MTSQEILELLKFGERINLECKKAESKIPNSVWETYSAFANTEGGIILFGVEENTKEQDAEKRFSFVSIKNPSQRLSDFWNTINSNKVNTNLLVDADVGICKVNNADIIWINVPQATYKQKPVYINENPMRGTYKRNHEGDYHCTEEEIKAMFRDASDSGNDGGLLTGYTIDDIDLNALRSYRIEFEHQNPGHVWNGIDDLTFLKNLGGFTMDRASRKSWLTTAGLLMFGKGIAVRERFDNIRMDYLDESNLVPGSRWSDRITYDGTWENNLYNFVRLVIPKLVSGIKRPFSLDGITRVDDTPIHKALREAVTNMIIHSDYLITGVLQIIKTDSCFIFSNPGNLKLPVQTIYEGGYSVSRNPKIELMFRMIGLGDNIGSGFPTILKAWGAEQWRKPDLSQNDSIHQVELRLWMISLMPTECIEFLKQLFGSAYEHLNREEQLILGTAYLENEVSNVRMQSVLELHSTEIGHILAGLVEKNMLIANKKGRWTSYQLNADYKIESEQTKHVPNSFTKLEFKNNTDRIIYEYICTNGLVTSADVLAKTDITSKQGAIKALNRLIELGLIKKIRQGRQFIYKLT